MNGIRRILLLMLLLTSGCGPGKDGRDASSTDTPATTRPDQLVGTWVRPIDGQDGTEGMRLDVDGVLGMVNIHTMHGQTWEAHDDSITLFTNTPRYPNPTATTWHVVEVTENTLTLNRAGDVKTVYMRDDAASGRLNGVVSFGERVKLPGDASVQVMLTQSAPGDIAGAWVAGTAVPVNGRQLPIPFTLTFATEEINSQAQYQVSAVIIHDGNAIFTTAEAATIDPFDPPAEIVIPLKRRESSN